MANVVQVDTESQVTVTPVFKYVDLENVPQSEQQGHEVRRSLEVVEVHTAGSRNSVPVFPVDAMWRRDGNRIITYAERWPEQYQAFKQGGPQEAMGTPLEMLRQHGVTPEHISLCRSLKIYSVEALDRLSHDGTKALGVHANKLKDAAREFMAGRDGFANARAEIEELKAQLAALTGVQQASQGTQPPVAAEESEMTDIELKEAIKAITGQAPRGNPSRDTLLRSLSELQGA